MELLEGKVVGIFNSITNANNTINDLYNNGFNDKYVSVIGKDTNFVIIPEITKESGTEINHANFINNDLSYLTVGSSDDSPDENIKGNNLNNSFDELRDNNPVEVTNQDIKEGAKAGVALGLFGAVAALMIPGIGPILATGPILAVISSVVGGAAVGSVMSFIKDDRIPNSRADFYTLKFNEGNILIFVDTDLKFLNAAKVILAKHDPITVDTF